MPTTRKQQIADLVREGRVRAGWTQAQLAEVLGVDTQSVGHWERALFKPRQDKIEALEDALNIDLSAEAIAIHTAVDEIAWRLTERVKELGQVEGFQIVADILEAVETWKPRQPRRRPMPVDGDSPENAHK